jgi:hypothetical protein
VADFFVVKCAPIRLSESINGTMLMTSKMHWIATRASAARAALWLLAALLLSSATLAGPIEQAQRMHDRLAGVPPSEQVLTDMVANLPGNPLAAALIATQDKHFYTVTLKNFAAPWTNRDQSAFVPLNDYVTLVIGLVKDNERFDQILYDDVLYTGVSVSPAPAANSNAHFEALESAMLEPSFNPVTQIQRTAQSSVYGVPSAATAGAMTTRAAAEAFFVAGTNRAMFRFTLMNHMCMDLEQVHDTSIVPDRIRQDVSRSPGGDSRVFLNNCIGCHAGMDPLAQAFAYYNYDDAAGSIVYDPSQVHSKYFNNEETFADGFVTPDDSWSNYWRKGQNALIGWDPSLPGAGNGAKTLGQELAASEAFAHCQAEKVFKNVCLRSPVDAPDRAQVDTMADTFRTNYDLRRVFADAAVYCRGN